MLLESVFEACRRVWVFMNEQYKCTYLCTYRCSNIFLNKISTLYFVLFVSFMLLGSVRQGKFGMEGEKGRLHLLPHFPLTGPPLCYYGYNEGSFISISAQSHLSQCDCCASGMRMSGPFLGTSHACACFKGRCSNAFGDSVTDMLTVGTGQYQACRGF